MHANLDTSRFRPEIESTLPSDFVAGLNLSVRAMNVLRRMNLKSFIDFFSISNALLSRQRNCGKKTTAEIMAAVESLKNRFPESQARLQQIGSTLSPDFVADLNLGVRATGVLRRMKLHSYTDLFSIGETSLSGQRSCGKKTTAEIMAAIQGLKNTFPESRPDFKSPVGCLGLPPSTAIAIKSLGIESMSDLALVSDEELLRAKIDLGSLAEIRGKLGEAFATSEKALALLEDKNPVEYLRLSIRTLKAVKSLKITTVGELAGVSSHDFLKLPNFGRRSLYEIRAKLLNYFIQKGGLGGEDKYEQVTLPSNPKAFVETLLAELPQDLRDVLTRRFGLWNRKPEILQDIGDSRGCTRERIRQLESKALASLNWPGNQKIVRRFLDRLYKKHFSTVLQKGYGITTEDEFRSVFLSLFGHLQEGMSVEKLLSKAFWNGDSLYEQCCLKAQNGVFTANEKLRREYLDAVTLVEKHLARAKKPVPISDLLLIIRSERPQISNGTVPRILQVAPSLQTDDKGLCGLSEWQYMRPKTLGDMIVRALVDIGKPAHFTQITMRINEKFSPQAPLNPRNVHARLLHGQETFVWQSSGVYGLTAWGLKKAPFVKDRLVQILKSAR